MPPLPFPQHVARLARQLDPKRHPADARDALRSAVLDACASVEAGLPADADPAARAVLDAVRAWALDPVAERAP